MTTPAALPRLMLALRRCSPTVRDQLTAGTLEQPRQVLEATAGRLRFTDAQLSAAVRHWAAEEVGRRTSRVEVFASASGAPTAHVVRVRERVERPGMYLVEVLCPYAHLHTWRKVASQIVMDRSDCACRIARGTLEAGRFSRTTSSCSHPSCGR